MKEVWKDVVGYEGMYQVSNLGRVKRMEYTKPHWPNGISVFPEKILKGNLGIRGYITFGLYKNLKNKTTPLHRIISMAFIPNPENKRNVNHINGIKTDNRIENLEWATSLENNRHAFDTGLMNPLRGEKSGASKLTEEQAKKIKYQHNNLIAREVSGIYGVGLTIVYAIRKGKNWKHI